jgi:hypothetical protein
MVIFILRKNWKAFVGNNVSNNLGNEGNEKGALFFYGAPSLNLTLKHSGF